MLLFFPKTPSVALKKMRSLPPPLRSPPRGGQHFKPFNSRSCLVPRPAGRRPSRKKSPTTALNHSALPSAHTAELKPSEAKKMHSPPPPLRSPPRGGQHFKPFNSRSCLVPRPAGRRPSRKKSPTTALNHSALPSAHTAELKPSEAKKMHSPPPPLRSPPRGGQHFKPFNSRYCPCLCRPAEGRAVKKAPQPL